MPRHETKWSGELDMSGAVNLRLPFAKLLLKGSRLELQTMGGLVSSELTPDSVVLVCPRSGPFGLYKRGVDFLSIGQITTFWHRDPSAILDSLEAAGFPVSRESRSAFAWLSKKLPGLKRGSSE